MGKTYYKQGYSWKVYLALEVQHWFYLFRKNRVNLHHERKKITEEEERVKAISVPKDESYMTEITQNCSANAARFKLIESGNRFKELDHILLLYFSRVPCMPAHIWMCVYACNMCDLPFYECVLMYICIVCTHYVCMYVCNFPMHALHAWCVWEQL